MSQGPRKLSVLIVDDEPPARRRLVRMLAGIEDCEVVGEAGDGPTAIAKIERLDPDLVLLDIGLPGLDGIEVAETASNKPAIVFVTAHADFAVEAFEAEAVDYLVKPLQPSRLEKAVRRAAERVDAGDLERTLRRLSTRLGTPQRPRRITARQGTKQLYFDPAEITCFLARDKYTVFHHSGEKYLSDESLASLEKRLVRHGFLRVHRAALLRLDAIRALSSHGSEATAELIDGRRIPVSRRRVGALREALEAL